jgi:hypothetical protein
MQQTESVYIELDCLYGMPCPDAPEFYDLVQTEGETFDDLIENLVIFTVDKSGVDCRQLWLDDLPSHLQATVQRAIVKFLNTLSSEGPTDRDLLEQEQRGRDAETVRGLNKGDFQ